MLSKLLTWFRDFEPAWLNSIKAAAIGLLAIVGVTLGTELDAEISFYLGVATVLLTQLQAILTRFGVFAPATVADLLDEADAQK